MIEKLKDWYAENFMPSTFDDVDHSLFCDCRVCVRSQFAYVRELRRRK